MASASTYDAIIIGGGHNGLVTAAYLAGNGRRVLVLEARELVGGCAVTEEVWPGFKISTASYLLSLMQEKVVRDLDLAKYGYKVDPKNPAFFSPFPDGRYILTWQDQAQTCSEIARFSKKDAEAYPKYEAYLERLGMVAESLLLVTPPDFPPASIGDFIEYIKLLGRMRGLSKQEMVGMVRLFTQSVAEFLDEWFESEELKVMLATDGVIGANGGPRSPGTAYILLHHTMGGVEGHRGLWGFVRGGMGTVSNAIADSARARGAEIRVNSTVSKILVKDGRAYGVALNDGTEFHSKVIATNLDPIRTFTHLTDSKDLPSEFLGGIRNFRSEGTSLKMNLALKGKPRFKALPEPGPHLGATMHICPSVEYIERAWDDCKYGRPSHSPAIEMTMPTMYDRSLAPEGYDIMGIFLQYAPYTLKDATWDDLREPYSQRIFDVIEEYVPNIRDITVHYQTLSPLDLERRFGITGGNIFHGEMSLNQMFVMRPLAGWAKHRTPIGGLYICGSGAHPGGGVMGAPGHNCAREILKDT